MYSYTGYAVGTSGVIIFSFSVVTLLCSVTKSASVLSNFSLPDTALGPLQGYFIAAAAIGIYFILVAYEKAYKFFVISGMIRVGSAVCYWIQGGRFWLYLALLDGICASLTMGLLKFEMYSIQERLREEKEFVYRRYAKLEEARLNADKTEEV